LFRRFSKQIRGLLRRLLLLRPDLGQAETIHVVEKFLKQRPASLALLLAASTAVSVSMSSWLNSAPPLHAYFAPALLNCAMPPIIATTPQIPMRILTGRLIFFYCDRGCVHEFGKDAAIAGAEAAFGESF